MLDRTTTTLGVALLTALGSAAMAQPGGGGRQGGGPPDPAAFIDRMMENDANGDGKLSADELPGRFAERMFESGDTNGDGFLDRAELQTVAETFAQRGGQRLGQPGQPGQPGARPGGPDAWAPREGGAPAGAPAAISFKNGMTQAGRALRMLRRSGFDDASRASDLRAIQAIQSGLIAAKAQAGGVPMAPQAKEHYQDDQVKYQSDMRLDMIAVLMESLALEDAVIRGDTAGAKESLEHLLAAQKEAHAAFQPEEEEDEAAEDAIPEPARVRPGGADRAPGRQGRPGGDA